MARRPLVLLTVLGLLSVLGLVALAAGAANRFGDPDPSPAAPASAAAPENAAKGPTSSRPDPTRSAGRPGSAPSVPAEETAVCAVLPSQLTRLTRIARRSPPLENLREGLPLLRDRLVELDQAAQGRPALLPVADRVRQIQAAWKRALQAHDAGRNKLAQAELRRADRQIDRLPRVVDRALGHPPRDCKA